MEIFSFIGLLLSVFGAALASISGLRIHYEKFLSGTLEDLESQVDIVAERGIEAKGKANEKAGKIRFWHRVWMICHWVPVALFSILTFAVIYYVCFQTEVVPATDLLKNSQINVTIMKWVLTPFFGANLSCFIIAFSSVTRIKFLKNAMGDFVVVAGNPGTSGVESGAAKMHGVPCPVIQQIPGN